MLFSESIGGHDDKLVLRAISALKFTLVVVFQNQNELEERLDCLEQSIIHLGKPVEQNQNVHCSITEGEDCEDNLLPVSNDIDIEDLELQLNNKDFRKRIVSELLC